MNKQEYLEKLGHPIQKNETIERWGQDNYYRDIPLNDIPIKSIDPVSSTDMPMPYLELGSGFLIGMAVGFFIKKSFKIVLFILGFALIITFYMEAQGIFIINDKVLEESISNGSKYIEYLISAVKERITGFQSGVGATAGFIVGLKLG